LLKTPDWRKLPLESEAIWRVPGYADEAGAREVDKRLFLGLFGILLATMTSEFNDQVTAIALVDVRGGFSISRDPGTWIQSLYVSAQIVGMAVSPWMLVTFSLRRWTLFSIALCGVSSALIPFSPNIEAIYALRVLQGFSGGLLIPLLMTTALRVFSIPNVRIYGLAVYALTAGFTNGLGASLAALWTEFVDWRFIFFQAVPTTMLAGALVWYGESQDEPHYERFRIFDWRGVLLLVVGFGAFSTMLLQGDRLDWFNSKLICVLALVSALGIPLFLLNEWLHPLPLIKLQLLGRRNIAYGCLALFTFLIVAQAGSTVPLTYLQATQGYRPLQAQLVTLEVALPQLLLLPAVAYVLDFDVDPRFVSLIGLGLMLVSCVGPSFVDYTWNRDQFYFWQVFQMLGQPMVTMSLLELITNDVKGPQEAPFVSALVNTPRGVSEAVAAWLLQLIARWRGSLHSDRIVDQLGQNRFELAQNTASFGVPPTPTNPAGASADVAQALSLAVQQQVTILSIADTYLILGALTALLMVVVVLLPVHTPPPRIVLTRG
jgi:MFS transporter, DHA2 family, multidrug resistance protein